MSKSPQVTPKTKLLDESADKDCYGNEVAQTTFLDQLLLRAPVSFMSVNIVIPVLHIIGFVACKFWLVPHASAMWVPMLQSAMPETHNDFIRVAWSGVLFGFFMYWFTFVVSAVHASLNQAKGFDVRVPRADNPIRTTSKTAQRLLGAHQNANEDLMIFGLAIACACALGQLTVGGADAANKEIACMTIVHMIGRALHFLAYAADVPFLRAMGYVLGLQTNAYIFAGAIFGAYTGWAQ